MSAKKIILISLALILVSILVIGGIRLYKKLGESKLAHETDIYTFIPSGAGEVIRINSTQGLQDYYRCDSSLMYLAEPLKKYTAFPLFIVGYNDGQLLITKTNPEYEDEIRKIVGSEITSPPYAKKRMYADAELWFYGMADNRFMVCCFYRGVFMIGKNYKLIERVFDSRGKTFFDGVQIKEIQKNIRHKYPSDIFSQSDSLTYALGLNVYADTLVFEGIAITRDSTGTDIRQLIMPADTTYYEVIQTDTLHVGDAISIKIHLNKKPEITFNN